ncbi:MAG TPA: type IV toxin-antitoxin system AbiEi family antitoxin domain-containing protein [Solirubrobacteraceae bacterium]|jgi:predicted transcriptional regulator of viral defense system|nr:type IV toxin-antitoxin system AbiEi family antitoxin domain-containing protein [Solirubrobacteraceae bacterium]
MPGARYKQLAALAADNFGFLTSDDARDLSIPVGTINAMARRGQLEHVAHGVYRIPLTPPDRLAPYKLATLWPDRRGLISHQSALALHGTGELDPDQIHVTVPASYRTHRPVPAAYVLRHEDVAPEDHELIDGIGVVSRAVALHQVYLDELRTGAGPA